jgi:hypothetical protein
MIAAHDQFFYLNEKTPMHRINPDYEKSIFSQDPPLCGAIFGPYLKAVFSNQASLSPA